MPIILPVLFLAIGWLLLWRAPRLTSDRACAPPPGRLSVIIPAFNEAGRISPLLESLQRQTLPPTEVLVLDDGCTDDTVAVAQRLGAMVYASGQRPAGWNGKTWACWQGAQRSRGDLLVFLDADTWLADDGLQSLAQTQQRRGGLLSVQPYHVTRKPYEQLSAFFNIIAATALNSFTPFGERSSPGGAYGPCMLCARADYFAVGGHAAVCNETIEDIPLGQRFARAGLPVSNYLGRGAVCFRMYPGGLGDLLQGHTKGFAYGALAIPIWMALLLSAWITGCFSSAANLIRGLISAPLAPETLFRVGLYCAYVVQVAWMLRRLGRFQFWVAPLYPIPLTFFGLVMLRSLVMTRLLGRVTWKGRTIATRNGRAGA